MGKRSKLEDIFIVVILIITFVAYLPVFKTFIQLDDWFGFPHFLALKDQGLPVILTDIFKFTRSHYLPLYRLVIYITEAAFGLNFTPYALISILLHLVNVFLFYKLSRKIFQNTLYPILASVLFALNSSIHQATSWPIADYSVHLATAFTITCLMFLLKYFKEHKSQDIILSFISLVCSLLFKEVSLGVFLFIPFFAFYYDASKGKRLKNLAIVSFLILLIYLIARVAMTTAPKVGAADKLATETQSVKEIAINVITFPVKITAQTTFPTDILLKFSKIISSFLPESIRGPKMTTEFDLFSENVSLQFLYFALFLTLIILLFSFRKKAKNLFKIGLTGFVFTVLNSFIYAISPNRHGLIPVVDSRNLYLPAMGTSIIVVSILGMIFKKNLRKISLVVILLVLLNIFCLNKTLKGLAEAGTERRQILNTIKSKYPTLPQKVIVYTISDTSFYGLPEEDKILPFDVNFGRALLVWYFPTEKYSAKFYENTTFLFGLTRQGYEEFDGRGFGYFRDLNLMRKALRENKLGKDSVFAFSYDHASKTIEDITLQTRQKL